MSKKLLFLIYIITFPIFGEITEICTLEELENLSSMTSGHFSLCRLDLSGAPWETPIVIQKDVVLEGGPIVGLHGDIPFISENYGTVEKLNLSVQYHVQENSQPFGPLVGKNFGTIYGVVVVGNISGNFGEFPVGGIVGENWGEISQTRSELYFSNISATAVGGMVGFNHGSLSKSASRLTLAGLNNLGGLIGITDAGAIRSSFVEVFLSSPGSDMVGGLVGTVQGNSSVPFQIEDSNVYGSLNAGYHVGGLIGMATNTTVTGWSDSEAEVQGNLAGGLIGTAQEKVTISKVTAGRSVQSPEAGSEGLACVGGLVGKVLGASGKITIERASALGSVSTRAPLAEGTGGLVGCVTGSPDISNIKIENTYSTSKISGTAGGIGGLIGSIQGMADVINSYSSGLISASSNAKVGGFIGICSGKEKVIRSYWNISESQMESSCKGIGKTANALHNSSNYFGWDFVKVWKMEGTPPLPTFILD